MTLFAAGFCVTLAPRAARSQIGGAPGLSQLFGMWVYNVCDPRGGTIWSCRETRIELDPQGDVVHVADNIAYAAKYQFSAAASGPLDVFSVGGSTPPVRAGIGTVPLPVSPTPVETPGAPLPGSTLSLSATGGVVSLDYVLNPPVRAPTQRNFFVLVFEYRQPVLINAALSRVTYVAAAPFSSIGAQALEDDTFTVLSSLCETIDPTVTCHGENPVASVTISLAVVPEPSMMWLLAPSLLAIGARRRRTSRGAVAS